jgi:hypothetical protein
MKPLIEYPEGITEEEVIVLEAIQRLFPNCSAETLRGLMHQVQDVKQAGERRGRKEEKLKWQGWKSDDL